MALRLYDSLTREAARARARASPTGCCGSTTAGRRFTLRRTSAIFGRSSINDVIRRMLELEFGAAKVRHVRNLTDVDDRTIGQSKKEQRPLAEITQAGPTNSTPTATALNCLPPHVEPTATGHIREQVNMIDVLMEKGNAYRAADGSVYFKISSFPDLRRAVPHQGAGAQDDELRSSTPTTRTTSATSRSGRPTRPRRTATCNGRGPRGPRPAGPAGTSSAAR